MKVNEILHDKQALLKELKMRNDTGIDDETVMRILEANKSSWTSYDSVEDMFDKLGINKAGLHGTGT